MSPIQRLLQRCLFVLLTGLCGAAWAQQGLSGAVLPVQPGVAGPIQAQVDGGAVSAIGPGDVLRLVVFGQPDLTSQVTVSEGGEITVPFLGAMQVANESPSAVARRIEQGLKNGGYLRNPQVSIEVTQVRSRVASVLGEVQRPGRYAIEGNLSLLELLALAGGVKDGADENIVLMRRPQGVSDGERQRIEVAVGNRRVPTRAVQDIELQPGDVVYVPLAPRFFIYGEVGQSGAYPMETGLNVMRALSIAGGLTQRASDRRIYINRDDPATGETRSIRVQLTDPVLPGDVIHVDERLF